MDLVTPDVGLLFWTFVSFVILYFILKKFAWKPILGSVNDREVSIREALLAAENAKKEMENLKSDNQKILKEAKIERENMLKDAREIKAKLISDAENQAKEQASKLIEAAQLAIQNEKNSAMNELKKTVVELSVGIAEKVISSELQDKKKQLKVVENMLNEASLNN
ncbi:F0F1 ATP synthase subunit B [Flavobacteriaceae bacterium]|jgi:F-type H+-transporting ATPase subunit b|nr:F0F1 ATP synthase subunit B [Flavobacteriaceae bacterium]MDB9712079.1 F0F1 ATP synthase subunit B [Flavobacteriaceae bacterium]MDC1492185.1 F0F1 ATP synthase subunit B [Flavobacteriaceae bacterium]MDC1534961.1 F0F1 ATP synthase subunit B [Flavobacteriaceae bacterium]